MGQQYFNRAFHPEHKQNLRNSPLVEIEKVFHAPLSEVWKAWHTPSLVKQWWGPQHYSCPEAQADFQEGGKYLFAMEDPSGEVTWSTGVYEEIIPWEKIVCSDQFSDAEGNVLRGEDVGMGGNWPETLYLTIDFEMVNDNECKICLTHEGIPEEMHDDCVLGWKSTLNKLQHLVEHH